MHATRTRLNLEVLEDRTALSTLYCSPTGNDAGAGTLADPWRHLTYSLAHMQPGDELDLRQGLYREAPANAYQPKSGASADKPTVVRSYPGEVATVERTNGLYLFYFQGAMKNIRLENLDLDGRGGNTNSLVVFTDAGGAAPSDITVTDCKVHHSLNQGIQCFLSGSLSNPANCVRRLTITDNEIYLNGNDAAKEHGMYLQCSDSLVADNDVHDNAALGIQLYLQAVVDSGHVSTVFCSRNTFRGNYIHDNAALSGHTANGTGLLISCGTGNVAANNVCAHQSTGIGVDYYADQTLVANNTVWDNVTNYRAGTNTKVTNATFVNDLAWAGTITANNFIHANSSTYTIDHCLNLTAGTRGTNPLFVDATNRDFHLLAGSPCIDAGTAGTKVPDDKDGVARPQGSAWDIGAYEMIQL